MAIFRFARPGIWLAGSLLAWPGPSFGVEPGWQYSPLHGEGDRASLGCAADSTDTAYTCIAVRCEDDYAVGVHVMFSRAELGGDSWEITADRETRTLSAAPDQGPYGARFTGENDTAWLLDRLRHGSYIYLRQAEDDDAAFAFIDLTGSFRAINDALQWCAPRVPETGQPVDPGIAPTDKIMEKTNEPTSAGPF